MFQIKIYICRHMAGVPKNSIVLFPCRTSLLCCGLAGIVSFKNKETIRKIVDQEALSAMVDTVEAHSFYLCRKNGLALKDNYAGGREHVDTLLKSARCLKSEAAFVRIFQNKALRNDVDLVSTRLARVIKTEEEYFYSNMGRLGNKDVDIISERIELLKDTAWCLRTEMLDNITRVEALLDMNTDVTADTIILFKRMNAVLNSIDRLEVRGRDSAGISLMFALEQEEFEKFQKRINTLNLRDQFNKRTDETVLLNNSITFRGTLDENGTALSAVTLTYKVAAEVGCLGDNILFLRGQIKNDGVLKSLAACRLSYHTISAHTRWASVGAITEANCHPVDNEAETGRCADTGIIHVCLNGDIDNYLELKEAYEKKGLLIHKDITTDTKIIPLQIETHLKNGSDIAEAFRLAVNDFEGSHAISMHTDLAPGKLFLAQKGSGQAIFIGIADEHYMPVSEVYGFVEETPFFIKVDGEKVVRGKNGETQGQIFILDQRSAGGVEGISAMFYDGTPVNVSKKDVKQTEITSRDIDRQGYPHYFLKEISESPKSVEKTLQNRWKIKEGEKDKYVVSLDENVVPAFLKSAIAENRIRRIFFVGQGTAGVAALACSNILNYYLNDPSIHISALKASELSGFKFGEHDRPDSLSDSLVIGISQSGTTTDTNRAIDMARERGAFRLAIVNRRDSDITFKVDGVFYTSSGRDIEMSVASTKAFYSQIVAGAVLGLYIAGIKGSRDDEFITAEISRLLELPGHMRKVLAMSRQIETSAKLHSVKKTYWASVGSGPNKASADEIRIKLSELCYKTISSDFVEDKKHIDLSSEPLIIVCAAGVRGTVINDIAKDTAIFKAHKAVPIVITDEGNMRFDKYAADVFHVPAVEEHLAPILNTLAGHIWGYYAALAINEGSKFFYDFREDVHEIINEGAKKGDDVYEVILGKSFREKIAEFYNTFRIKKAENRFPSSMSMVSDLTLLLKYLAGKLPVSDFEIDFAKKGTALNMLNTLFEYLGKSINDMSRPVDAIKHQAKTVTVGTSRISEKVEGILFDALAENNLRLSQLLNRNVVVLKNLQEIVAGIMGSILYRIDGLSLLGEPVDGTTIEITRKTGVLAPLPSRVETDKTLKGTKRIIVNQGNVYIGKGRKDDRSIIVIPLISDSAANPNMIEYLLLLNISFKENIPLFVKIKALGGKYEHIKNIVQENSIIWNDTFLDIIETSDLFGISAEKIGELIVSKVG